SAGHLSGGRGEGRRHDRLGGEGRRAVPEVDPRPTRDANPATTSRDRVLSARDVGQGLDRQSTTCDVAAVRRPRPTSPGDRVDGADEPDSRKTAGVPPRGFEPLISTLKGWRPRPLDDGGQGRRPVAESSRGAQPGPLASRNRMTATA